MNDLFDFSTIDGHSFFKLTQVIFKRLGNLVAYDMTLTDFKVMKKHLGDFPLRHLFPPLYHTIFLYKNITSGIGHTF